MVAENSSMADDCYVPILKCKQGELGALGWLDPALRARLIPLMEVRNPAKQAPALASAWGTDDVIFVHPLNIDEHEDADWHQSVQDLFESLRLANVRAVPVATTDDAPGLVAELAATIAIDRRGVCIRIDGESLALAPPQILASELGNLLSALGVGEEDCDLVVDLGLVRDSLVARVTTGEAALRVLPNLPSWRNVVLAYSAFPESVGDVAATSRVTQITREDALAYATLVGRGQTRTPIFGDYAVGVPFYADIPWAPIPALRYSQGDFWYVHRGATKANRSAQYVQLATDLTAASHFAGATASGGDRYLASVAAGHDGPGNPTTYVRAGVSRHLACVLDRLATLGVP